MTPELAAKVRALVFRKAKKFGVPPVMITAHVRNVVADKARCEVWHELLTTFNMTRQMVADLFGRDRRRIRASVIAKHFPPKDRPVLPPVAIRTLPFQPVGNQFVWCFAVPLMLERPVMPIISPFMKPVPGTVRDKLGTDDRLAMARFYEREAKRMRNSLVQ